MSAARPWLAPAWQPGQSGNPNGRARLTEDQKKARDLARKLSVEALTRLRRILRSKNAEDKDVIQAAKVILSHGLPKEVQLMLEESAELTREQQIAKLRGALEVLEGGKGKVA